MNRSKLIDKGTKSTPLSLGRTKWNCKYRTTRFGIETPYFKAEMGRATSPSTVTCYVGNLMLRWPL